MYNNVAALNHESNIIMHIVITIGKIMKLIKNLNKRNNNTSGLEGKGPVLNPVHEFLFSDPNTFLGS